MKEERERRMGGREEGRRGGEKGRARKSWGRKMGVKEIRHKRGKSERGKEVAEDFS